MFCMFEPLPEINIYEAAPTDNLPSTNQLPDTKLSTSSLLGLGSINFLEQANQEEKKEEPVNLLQNAMDDYLSSKDKSESPSNYHSQSSKFNLYPTQLKPRDIKSSPILNGSKSNVSKSEEGSNYNPPLPYINITPPKPYYTDLSGGINQINKQTTGAINQINKQTNLSGYNYSPQRKPINPNLPPLIDITVSRMPNSDGDDWTIMLGMEGWLPARSEFMLNAKGVNGQDLMLTLQGLTVGEATNLGIDSEFTIRETSGGINEVTTSTRFVLSNRLDWIHAELINRDAGARTEMLINDIPESIDLQASLGTSISIDMIVPEKYRRDGPAVDSIMLQQMQWMEGAWWPATVFLTDVPDSINLTTEADVDYDITKTLAFQGTPVLDFSASDSGMSLYIEANGRAINNRGDIILLAEGLTDRMVIKPTSDYGLAIRSGGDGVERIYLRASNMPTTPPMVIEEVEALGENLRSATIRVVEIVGPYSIIELEDVQGGRIIASARASAEVDALGTTLDLRGVLLDAQTTGGVPTGTSIGVNGLASDLSLLNLIPGFEGSTHHIIVPEPFSSGVLTLCATFLGGD